MKHLIHKVTLTLLLSLGLLGVFSPAQVSGQTGPLPTTAAKVNRPAEATQVHLIVTGYTLLNGTDIGPDCQADLLAVQSMFSQTFVGQWRNRLVIHPLYGEAWTAVKVQQFLKEMRVGPNDVLVFYHAGHGGIQNAAMPVETHKLLLNRTDYLVRKEVRKLLLARNCRGVILLTDCCSSLPKVAMAKSRSFETRQQGPAKLNPATIRNLFLRFQGLVDITAAEVGQDASNGNQLNNFGGAKGDFTTAFLKVACETREFNNWGHFFPALRDMTRMSSGKLHQAHAFVIREGTVSSTQTPPPAFNSSIAGTVTGPIAK